MEKAKQVNMDVMLNARNADMQGLEEFISLGIKKNAMKTQRNGIKKTDQLLTRDLEKDTQLTNLLSLSAIESTQKKSRLNIWFNLMCDVAGSLNHPFAQYAIVKARKSKDITRTIQNRLKSFGFVLNATTISINLLKIVCSLNDQTLWTLNKRMRWPEHYGNIVRGSEIPPRLEIGLKTSRSSRSNRMITNDLWVQNLRSSGI